MKLTLLLIYQGSLWSGHLNLGQLGTPATTLPDTSMPPPAPRSPWSHEPIVSSVSTGPTMSTTPAPPPTSDAASVRFHLIDNAVFIARVPILIVTCTRSQYAMHFRVLRLLTTVTTNWVQ